MNIIKLIVIIGALILSFVLIKNIAGIMSVKDRVSDARQEVERLQNEQNEIKKKLEVASSAVFIEEVARDKLGLAKEGETVVVLPNDDFLKSLSPSLEVGEHESKKATWEKWWERFF
ncbi:septum formation initiator family protein [Candidatus Microgenomates bacterium]|nr:septum formation initiator family protein [Candidatus Microgenomates bacterium]